MKDTKHIRRDFHYVGWVMPQGWNFGVWGCPGGQKKFDEQNRMQVKYLSYGQTDDLGVRSKVKYL